VTSHGVSSPIRTMLLPIASTRVQLRRFCFLLFCLMLLRPPCSTLFPYTTLFRSRSGHALASSSWTDPAAPYSTKRPSSSTATMRSEEHTSELQSRFDLVCRLLLEKKKET